MAKWTIIRTANEAGEQINALREGDPASDQGVTMAAPVDESLRGAATLALAVNIIRADRDAEIVGDHSVAAAVTKERKNTEMREAIASGDMGRAHRIAQELMG